MTDFTMLGLAPALEKALSRLNLTEATPIQARAIPPALQGRDVLGLAQTGTGKTLAFGLPLLDALLAKGGKPAPKTAKALILAPTRELANQIADSLRALAEGTRIKVAVVVGGQSINRQIGVLARGIDVLVATPGRLIDLMDRRAVDLSTVGHLVLDEADQMLDLGFIHALRRIAPALGTPRQTMLFSATMPGQMEELSRAYLDRPERIQVAPPGKAADKIEQSVHFVEKARKPARLRAILDAHPDALTLVFGRTKHGSEKLMKGLRTDGYDAASIHGNKSQGQRDRAIAAFKAGEVRVLVATDVAARGIDVPGVGLVVNYDLPEVPDAYVHRIGRTARAGADGQAVALCSEEEVDLLAAIEKTMKMPIPVASGERPEGTGTQPKRRGGGGRRGGPGKPQGKSQGAKRDGGPAGGRPGRRRRRRAA
ncbi:ATP-dependent RNA helicase RhlE [Hasllibacter halocynthiae]|uniref:ATP-dependent RNA helicase RhlE n=1 Tax=Hasllibacter halocynthiae TaxID=595589 RepID=A0A2T0X4G3_9RHOB|nr:DEAD/DEAH box helicase [Hasllibacter halocynthiae]PRY93754.1 ATP-dependent RNA helicase RhlE [Hasllibacter halocynthiae]